MHHCLFTVFVSSLTAVYAVDGPMERLNANKDFRIIFFALFLFRHLLSLTNSTGKLHEHRQPLDHKCFLKLTPCFLHMSPKPINLIIQR